MLYFILQEKYVDLLGKYIVIYIPTMTLPASIKKL